MDGDVARQGLGFTGSFAFRVPSPERVFRMDPKMVRMIEEVVKEMGVDMKPSPPLRAPQEETDE